MQAIGADVPRFQEASFAFDEVAAEILAVHREDLPCMALLLFGGPSAVDHIAGALGVARGVVVSTLERLQLAGYVREQPGGRRVVELTEHAHAWIEQLWLPLRRSGEQVLAGYTTAELAAIGGFVRQACEISERHTAAVRRWLAEPASPARHSHLRGGLSPASLRRVQVFVEANLARPIHLHDLSARAGLSVFHFARAFKRSAGMTPRAFIEARRVEHARQLLRDTAVPLSAVAVDTGFGSQSRLTTVFKRRTGFTPAAYRRGHT